MANPIIGKLPDNDVPDETTKRPIENTNAFQTGPSTGQVEPSLEAPTEVEAPSGMMMDVEPSAKDRQFTDNGQPETYRIFDTQTPVALPNPKDKANDVYYHAALSDMSVEAMRPTFDSGATEQLEAQASAAIENDKARMVDDFIAKRKLNEMNDLQAELKAIPFIDRFVTKATLAMLTSDDAGTQEYGIQRYQKVIAAHGMVQDAIASSSESTTNTIGDFIDVLVTSPFNALKVKRQRELSDRAEALIASNMDSDVFEVQFKEILTEMSDQGFLTKENAFYMGDFGALLAEGSASETANTQKAWALLDTGLSALTAAGSAVKVAKNVNKLGVKGAAIGTVRTAFATTKAIVTYPARLVGHIKGDPKLVDEVLEEARKNDILMDPAGLHTSTSPSIMTPDNLRTERWAHTSSQANFIFETRSKAMAIAKKMLSRTGSALDDTRVEALGVRLTEEAEATATANGSRRLLDTDIRHDELDNLVFTEIHGTNKGGSFKGPNGLIAAQHLADNIGGEVNVWMKSDEYVVTRSKNVNSQVDDVTLEGLNIWGVTDINELESGLKAAQLTSPALQTTAKNRAALLLGESVQEVWMKTAVARIEAVKKGISRKQLVEVDKVFYRLRDGADSSRKSAYNMNEFEHAFGLENKGARPTKAQKALYATVQESRDVESFLLADEFFKKQVNDGVVVLDDEYRVVASKTSEVPAGQKVYDVDSGKLLDPDDIPEGQTIYRNYDPKQDMYGTATTFVVGKTLRSRKLYHSDILARNAGGTRLYKKGTVNRFVKQNRTKKMADGSVHKVSPVTVMGTKTLKESKAAVQDLNTIVKELVRRLGDDFDFDDLGSLAGRADLDNFIAVNSKWNPSVNNLKGLAKWADDSGVDLSKKFDDVGHGEALIDPDIAGGFAGQTFERAMDARALNPRSRGDNVLMGYGGKQNEVLSPMQSMEKSTSELIANQSYAAYSARAINGLLKSGIRNGSLENAAELKGLTLRQKLSKAVFRDERLKLEALKIEARLNRSGWGDQNWSTMMNKLSDVLYDSGAKGLSNLASDIGSTNPATALRGFVFHAKLGMFNPSQLYVQGSQVINVMGIAGKSGMQGAGLYPAVRMAIQNGNPEVVSALSKAVSKNAGITEDQFKEMVRMFSEHGRSTIGVSLAEFGADAAQATSQLGKAAQKAASKGLTFFNEGELMARTTAWNTAFIEYSKKFPTRVAKDQHGVRWIMNRQDTLTQAMSGASRTSFDRLPFAQFLSYQFRINEAIFAGSFGGKSILTGAERARLAVTHSVVFGTSAWGGIEVGMSAYEFAFGVKMDEDTYGLIRRGSLDFAVSQLTGVDTNLASRLGSGDNIYMMIKDMMENNTVTTLGGPGFEVGTEALGVVLGGIQASAKGVTTGDFEDLGESMGRFARVFSTGNQAYNAYTAIALGQYLTKDNALLDTKLTNMEGLLIGLGVPLVEHGQIFTFKAMQKLEALTLSSTMSGLQKAHNMANAQLDRGDYAGAKETYNLIALRLNTLSTRQQLLVDESLRKSSGSISDNIMSELLINGMIRDMKLGEE